MSHTAENPERFYGLDVLRGIAALGVVLCHWAHFFWIGRAYTPYYIDRSPFVGALGIFYSRGSLGVDLFFSLSGFIFAWLYAERIHARQMPAVKFAVLRFSRLYPLHFATLVFVALCQLYRTAHGLPPFVYVLNDLNHFLMNLAFVAGWREQDGLSFNGPAWSVSVEVFLYGVFFCCCYVWRPRLLLWLGMSIAGFFIGKYVATWLGRGIGSFFLGASMFLLYRHINARPHRTATVIAGVFLIVAWTATFVVFSLRLNEEWANAYFARTYSTHHEQFFWWSHKIFSSWPLFFLFPLSILSLALVEPHIRFAVRHLSFIGDVSYSSYLFHFPLQLLTTGLLDYLGVSRNVVYERWFLIAFFATLISLGLLSYRYFERPMQSLIRRHFRGQPRLVEVRVGEGPQPETIEAVPLA